VAKFKDYYRVLGVPPRSHAKVIEETYWAQAHELHREPTKRAVKRLTQINEAYEVLGSPHRREVYDRKRYEFVDDARMVAQPGLLQSFFGIVGRALRPDG
jgi:curved DNA-binding protein CbpA